MTKTRCVVLNCKNCLKYKYPFNPILFYTLSQLKIFTTTLLIAKKKCHKTTTTTTRFKTFSVGNPYASSSSNPNWDNHTQFGMSSEEVFRQHQELRYWQESQQQNSLNTDFQNLQFTQQSQHSQTETNEVLKTPTSPPKKSKSRIKRKSKKKQRTSRR